MEANESKVTPHKHVTQVAGTIITNMVSNLLTMMLVTAVSVSGLGLVGLLRGIPPVVIYGIVVTGWVGSYSILYVIWHQQRQREDMQRKEYDDQRTRRIDRWEGVARMMFLADEHVRAFHFKHLAQITANHHTQYNDAIRMDIRYILSQALLRIAVDLSADHKAIAFMVMVWSARYKEERFQVVAQANHDVILRAQHVELPFGLSNSFAGQAIQQNRCLVLYDHRQKEAHVQWHPSLAAEYCGHAVAPVAVEQARGAHYYQYDDGPPIVGVLCMDFKPPHELDQEDRRILMMCADKIGTLWSKYQEEIA